MVCNYDMEESLEVKTQHEFFQWISQMLMELQEFQFQLSSFLMENCSIFFSLLFPWSFHCIMPFFILLSTALHLGSSAELKLRFLFSARVLKQGRSENILKFCIWLLSGPWLPKPGCFTNQKLPK